MIRVFFFGGGDSLFQKHAHTYDYCIMGNESCSKVPPCSCLREADHAEASLLGSRDSVFDYWYDHVSFLQVFFDRL